jgi:hypothetical protein
VTERQLPKLDRPQNVTEKEYELILELTGSNPESRPMMSVVIERLYTLEQFAIEQQKKEGNISPKQSAQPVPRRPTNTKSDEVDVVYQTANVSSTSTGSTTNNYSPFESTNK